MQLEFHNTEIFSDNKRKQLHEMMTFLSSVWENTSDEVLPFICRPKAQNILVSVIMPVCNAEKFLTKALQSITNQTLEDLEIICIDDGSTDRSPEILAFFAAFDERITIITQPASNAGCARNRGLEIATGKYLYFMDADDWCEPFMLETAVAAAEKGNHDLVAWSFLTLESSTHKLLWSKRYKNTTLDAAADKTIYLKLMLCVWNKLFRRQMVLDHGLRFQEITNNNDISFTTCAIAAVRKIRTISTPMYFYRKSGTGLQATQSTDPYGCIYARIHAKEEMERLGLWEDFYDHFRNSTYNSLVKQLALIRFSLEQLSEIRILLQTHFDYGKTTPQEVFDPDMYCLIHAMFFENEIYYPTKLFTLYRKRRHSHRVGNAVLWLPLKIKKGIQKILQRIRMR